MVSINQLLNLDDVNPAEEQKVEEKKKEMFLEDLFHFFRSIGKGKVKLPVMGYKGLNLYQLYTEVQNFGGFHQVTKRLGTWTEIWKKMDNFDNSITDASSRLKKNYVRFLLDYELFHFPHRREDNKRKDREGEASSASKKKKSKVSRLRSAIPSDSNGEPIFPFEVSGGITVHELGVMKNFGESGEWPVGFKTSRIFSSYSNPQKNVQYISEILEKDKKPVFVVTAMDDLDHPVTAGSPSSAWRVILEKISEQTTTERTRHVSVSGALRYGLLHPVVKSLLEERGGPLPNYTLASKKLMLAEKEEVMMRKFRILA